LGSNERDGIPPPAQRLALPHYDGSAVEEIVKKLQDP